MNATQSLESHQQAFLEAMEVRHYSPATVRQHGGSLTAFVRYLLRLGLRDVRDLTRQHLRDYLLWLQSQPYTVNTITSRFQTVRRFFEHLEATDVILLNPCAGIPVAHPKPRLPRHILTVEEAKAVLTAPDLRSPAGLRDKAILELFYSTGIRLEEMTRLTVPDVDCPNGVLRVNQGKFAKDRVVPLGSTAGQAVQQYQQQVRAGWICDTPDQLALWLSAKAPHGPLKSQAILVMVKHYGRKASLTKTVTPHVWRHTCASHLVADGADIAYVQRILGHRSLRTTQIYAHTTIAEVRTTHAQLHPRNQGQEHATR
jgi:integrase/recombinase XerD